MALEVGLFFAMPGSWPAMGCWKEGNLGRVLGTLMTIDSLESRRVPSEVEYLSSVAKDQMRYRG